MAKTTLPEYLAPGDGFVDITLNKPLAVNGVPTKVLRMREPLVEDQLAAAVGNDGAGPVFELGLMANLCDIDPASIRKLPIRDYQRVQRGFGTFTD